MDLVEQLQKANLARSAVSPDVFYKVWGYKGESGATRPLLASLNHYGLMEYIGRGDSKQVKLSALAHRIIFDKVPNSRERREALREAALGPTIFSRLMTSLGVPVPPEYAVETFLTRDCGYSEQVAKIIFRNYVDTLGYAGLDNPDTVSPVDPQAEEKLAEKQPAEIGDLVQVEIGGVFQLEKPAHVVSVQEHAGRKWAFVEGSTTGIPMEQVHVVEKGKGVFAPATPAPESPLLAAMLDRAKKAAAPGMRQEVFALDEGDVTLTFPAGLSPDSYSDLESYLMLFLKKAKRRAEKSGDADKEGAE
jgi:hypothetical protein